MSVQGLARAERRGAALASPGWALAFALVALAVGVQAHFGMLADVAWLIDCDERWLAGAVPYRDFFEINPPASLLLYLPAVALAKALGLPSEALVSAFGFLSAGAALALSAAILRPLSPPPSVGLAAVVALALMPGESFCERDHLAAVFGVPLLAAAFARAERVAVPLGLAMLEGIGAGAMAAIKPPYALIGLALAGYLAIRVGWRAALKAPEYYAAAVVGLAYLAAVAPFFPAYLTNVLPLGVDVYVPARENLATLVASPGALLILLIAATAALAAGDRAASPGFAVPALATLGALVAYFLQGKGWVYQAVPAMIFATLAGGFALSGERARAVTLGVGAAAAGLSVSWLHSLGLAFVAGLAAALAAEAARTRALDLSAARLGPLAFAAAVGAACGVCLIERPLTPALERQLAALGPHLTLGAVSEDMGLGFPLARRIGATWVLRADSLYVNSAVERLLTLKPDRPGAQKLEAYAAREREEFVDDIVAHRPDALLVGPVNTRLHARIWADPQLAAAMASYKRIGVEEKPGYTAELWLRKDFAPKP